MSKFLNETQYQQAMTRHQDGQLEVQIKSLVARRFFTHIGGQEVIETTGTSIKLKKLIVGSAVLAAPLIFLGALALVLEQYGPTTSGIVIPIIGICWTVIYGLTSDHGGWMIGTLPLALSLLFFILVNQALGLLIVLFVLSLWLQRFTYLISSRWLLEIVTQSFPAYTALEEHIELVDKK